MNRKVIKNAAWIIAGKITQALLGMIVTMLSARYLGPSGYGVLNYAASLVAFAVPVMQLGLNSTLVQELLQAPDQEGKILGTAITMTFVSSFACIVGVLTFSAVADYGEPQTVLVCGLYSILLIFQSLEMIQYWFQAKLLSKYTAVTMLGAYICVSAYKILLLVTGGGVHWFALSQTLDYAIIAAALFVIYRRLGGKRLAFSFPVAKKLFSRSKYYIISSLMVTVFAQTDRIMLNIMLDKSAVGYYSAAVTCAGVTGFVFSAIIDSARPSVLEGKQIAQSVFEHRQKLLFSIVIYLSIIQSIFITIFGKLLVRILFGAAYAPTVPALRIIVWYTTFCYLGTVRNIWILAEQKQKYLWIINLSGALSNVCLNAVLIPNWGINGAAFASLITQIFSNVITGFIIIPIRSLNRIMLLSLHPKVLVESAQKFLKTK